MDALTVDILWLTLKVQAARIVRRIGRESGKPMAIDVSGLKAKALKARANWDRINAAYDKFNELAPDHATEVEGLSSGLAEMQTDLEFATNLMGNSLALPPKEPPPEVIDLTGNAAMQSIVVTSIQAVEPSNPIHTAIPMARAVPSRRDL